MDIEITHDKKNQKFMTRVGDSECYLNYNLPRKNVIDFYFTYVPGELRGKGIAAKLVEEGLQYAEREKLQVIPSCSYVNIYIHRYEKYKNLLDPGHTRGE
ncbi:MAG TPA: GNAT family N-acetyltransferase [Ignavibacteriaceae bacterium]|jgi:predicted GNAT family acetyltransferase|nr:GNAT family N-acetyltransferase [Ignavibacteriaceae bacterium]